MPTVYCYGRASTGRQTLTQEHQRSVCEEYVNRVLVPDGYTYGGWYYDSATSGGTALFERQKGRDLWALVQPGDRLVWAKLDRAFRSVVDAAQAIRLLAAKRVSFASLDLGLDTSTPIGRCVYTILVAFAELELEFIRERTRDISRQKRRSGLPHNGQAPIGWRKVGTGRDSIFLPDQEERAQVMRIAAMRAKGASLATIVSNMRGTRRRNGSEWHVNSVAAALRAELGHFPKRFPEPASPA